MTSQALRTLSTKSWALVLCTLLVCVGVGAVSSGCTNSAEFRGSSGMSEIVIVQSDQGKTFEINQGNVIQICLEENQSTGYQWEIDALDEQVVAFQDSDYSRVPGTGIGGGGVQTFTFKAQSPGTVKIRLKLRRAWEPEEAAIDRFEVTLRVQEE